MATEIPEISLYLDYAKPGGADPLLQGFTSRPVYSKPSLMSGDIFKLRLYFRKTGATADDASTQQTLADGVSIIVAGKSSSDLSISAPVLFCCTYFVQVTGSSDQVCYEGELNLDTAEMAAAMETLSKSATKLSAVIDVEIRNTTNSKRVTYRMTLDINRQVYSDTSALAGPIATAYLASPDGSRWQLTIDDNGRSSWTKVAVENIDANFLTVRTTNFISPGGYVFELAIDDNGQESIRRVQ